MESRAAKSHPSAKAEQCEIVWFGCCCTASGCAALHRRLPHSKWMCSTASAFAAQQVDVQHCIGVCCIASGCAALHQRLLRSKWMCSTASVRETRCLFSVNVKLVNGPSLNTLTTVRNRKTFGTSF